MNRGELRIELRRRLGELVPDFWTDAELNDNLNEAVRRFTNEERWPWLYTHKTSVAVAADTRNMPLEKDVLPNRHFDLQYTAEGDATLHAPKRVLPAQGFRLHAQSSQQKGNPSWFYLASAAKSQVVGEEEKYIYVVYFVPVPDKNLTVEYQYIRRPVEMADDDDIPDVPEDYTEAVVAWSTGLSWLKELNGSPKAQEQFNIYNAVLEQAQEELKHQPNDTPLVWGGEPPEYKRPRVAYQLPLGL